MALTKKQGTGKAKKPHVIKAAGSLDEFIKKHLAKVRVLFLFVFGADLGCGQELGLSSECPGSPFGFLCGNLPEFEKGSDAAGYVGCDDSESE